MAGFVHLHVHSEYSLLDGACRISELPKAARLAGQEALAITDHGAMYGAVDFYKACKAEGIKPIIGCEVYVAPHSRFDKTGRAEYSGNHLILLCKNEVGYKNLCRLVSIGFTEGFYQKPRIDLAALSEYHEGLIALSACLAGAIPQLIIAGRFEEAKETALSMRDLMGDGNFYLELQDHGLPEDAEVCRALIDISEKTGIPLVATNDIHYIRKSDAETQEVLMCIQTNCTLDDVKFHALGTDEFYLKTENEMRRLFTQHPEAIDNTVEIAEKCNFEFTFGETTMPTFVPEDGLSHKESLRNFTENGYRDKKESGRIVFHKQKEESYRARIEYELSVIDKMGFNAYFLIVRDFVAYAKEHGIPVGPGRGSGAGSLVAFCIGITDIDPMEYDLLFERFLNPERVSLPDFDIDFCYIRRDEVIRYVRERYGADHVAQIITFGTMAARAAIRDVGRALGMSYADTDRVAKLIPRELNTSLESALDAKPELRALYDSDERVRRLYDTAKALEGMPRHASTHAAGVVITEKPVAEYVPLAVNDGGIVTQYDMDTDAELGLVKFDFLGLRYLTILDNAVKSIRKTKPEFDLAKIPTDDAATYRLISDGLCNGVFQLESGGMKQMLQKLEPESLEDVIAAIALFRPGPMDSIPTYIARRHGKEKVTYAIPALSSVLDVTYGCIVYQEQVMQIFRLLADYSFAHADLVRRAMAKKKASVMAAEEEAFIAGAVKNGATKEAAKAVFDDMASFASYAFNKSHATAYAMISYQTAYLKTHYPKEYLASLLTSVLGDAASLSEYVRECQKLHIRVLPPDINESDMDFTVTDAGIRFGLLAVKNVGRSAMESLLRERSNGPFRSFRNFIDRMSSRELNVRMLESLIKCGAFDSFGVRRSQLLAVYQDMSGDAASNRNRNLEGQMDLFSDFGAIAPETEERFPDIPEYSPKELLILEKESTGLYFSGHILDEFREHTEFLQPDSISDILSFYEDTGTQNGEYPDGKTVKIAGIVNGRTDKVTKNGARMFFITVEDRFAEIEVVVFPNSAAKLSPLLTVENAVSVVGRVSAEDEKKPKIILSSAEPLYNNQAFRSAQNKEKKTVSNIQTEQKLYLRVPSIEDPLAGTAERILLQYPGPSFVVFYDEKTGKYAQKSGLNVEICPSLLKKLREYLGDENVVCK